MNNVWVYICSYLFNYIFLKELLSNLLYFYSFMELIRIIFNYYLVIKYCSFGCIKGYILLKMIN